jgi:bifunctional non-homologous end joining protein LigD
MAASRKPPAEVTLTNEDKVFFPEAGFTKGDLVRFYVAVAPYLLPHLRGRPVTVIRFPDGVEGTRFYEKNAPRFAPGWIRTAGVPRRHGEGQTNYILINDVATLTWCANMGAIELHPFLHRAGDLDRPTSLVFDLDPGEGADILDCAEVAFLIQSLLDTLGLSGFPKVSGSKGLQLHIPLNRQVSYAATGDFAKAVARLLEQQHPKRIVSRMAKVLRRGRVLIDWSQNSSSKTTVAVYSVRGKNRKPWVSMPVTWTELKRAVRQGTSEALRFSPEAALRRLQRKGDLFLPLVTLKQRLPKAFARREVSGSSEVISLDRYGEKRDFSRTPEPSPKPATQRAGRGRSQPSATPRFVVQKHAATRLHYDFRLEMDGTLKSWAIPKGIPTELGIKRAAIAVEDHPSEYLTFEGTIPEGQYGGGTVMVWDLGTYDLKGGSLTDGSLKLVLHGRKLKGEWHLFRIRSAEEKEMWLLTKAGKAAKAISARQEDTSALTGRSMAKITRDAGKEMNDPSKGKDRRTARNPAKHTRAGS